MCCSSVPACPARRQLLALGGTGGGCCLAPGNGKRKLGFWSPRTSCGDSCSPQEQGSLQQEGFGGVFGACSPSSSALLSAGSRGALGMQRGKGKVWNYQRFIPPPSLPICFSFSPEESARHCSASHSSHIPNLFPGESNFPIKFNPAPPEGSTGTPRP